MKMKILNKEKFKIFLVIVGLILLSIILTINNRNFNRPNILLITIDALRADHVGCYGYQRETTHHIDRFAKTATIFTQAIAQSSYTASSLPSILTSTYPHTHGILKWGDSLNPSISTLAQILKKNGYYTGAISAHNFFISLLGLERGFDILDPGGELNANEVTKKAIIWLKRNQHKNFFLWLHYFEPHEPYRPPAPYNKMFMSSAKNKNAKQVPILKYTPDDPDIYGGVGGVAERAIVDGIRDMDWYISLYDGEIRFADEQIGALLEEIDKLNLSKKTLIIITADHGESLGEHNLYFTHGEFLYDELIKVPLIIKYNTTIPKTKIVNSQVQLIDLMPTILDILRIKSNRKMEGESLLPLIQGKQIRPLTPYAFSYITGRELYSIRTEKYKLIYSKNKDEYELYNLENDPKELNNVIEIEKEKFIFLKEKLDEWMKQTRLISKGKERVLDEETKEKLKSLGYIQ